jgi:hypothetical protein
VLKVCKKRIKAPFDIFFNVAIALAQ